MATVKCPICGKAFDRDKMKCTKFGSRRYAHYSCYPSGELVENAATKIAEIPKEQQDKIDCEEYIKQLLGLDSINQRVRRQLNEYTKEKNYPYAGILLTLKYWYEVKGNDTSKAYGGIGIVPFVFDEAREYWMREAIIAKAREDMNKVFTVGNAEVITIKPPKSERKGLKSFYEVTEDEE